MPTPVGHALGGAIVALVFGAGRAGQAGGTRPRPHQRYQPYLPFTVIVACLPDLDFLWGRHNMETHSLGFAVLVGLVALIWRREGRLALACTLAVATHVLFDWLGSDDFPPLGVMALWPLTSRFYFADAFIFDAISRRYWLPGFVRHNVIAVLREIVILAPLAGALWFWRGRSTNDSRRHEGTEPKPVSDSPREGPSI
jgi:membrane-bound metal-dependent hydrolase YbcI (DUF457 family)